MRIVLPLTVLCQMLSQAFGSELPVDIDRVTGQYVATQAAPTVKTDSRPEVIFYSAIWCGVCPGAKTDIEKADAKGELPFRVRFIDDDAKVPAWVKSFPTTYWGDGPTVHDSSKCWQLSNWKGGLAHLKESFEKTRKGVAKQAAVKVVTKTVASTRTVDGHSHKCWRCGTVWAHTAASYGSTAAHTCSKCGSVQFGVYQNHVPVNVRVKGN